MPKFRVKRLFNGKKVTFYTVQFHGEKYHEFGKFLYKFSETDNQLHKNWARSLKETIQRLGDNGYRSNYFRDESPDNYPGLLWALPGYQVDDDKGNRINMRLYLLKVSETKFIVGNGAVKENLEGTSWQSDDDLACYCYTLLKVADKLLELYNQHGKEKVQKGFLPEFLSDFSNLHKNKLICQ